MQKCSIHDEIVGTTPSLLGVNVEVQENWENCNLWDWLADSNATVIREFHPEKCMRKQLFAVADFAGIKGQKDFDAWRGQVKADPDTLIPWDLYLFSQPVKWLGIPDGIMSKLGEIHVPALVSMGYNTRMFPLPLLDFEKLSSGKPLLECIDWKSAAPAYEYYFAMLHHFAGRFGNTRFTLHNEPEYDLRKFHCLGQRSEEDWSSEIWQMYWRMNMECAALCLIARLAMEDVREILPDRSIAANLFLGGPAWHRYWNDYWNMAHEWSDACDFHHYHPVPETFREIYREVAVNTKRAEKRTICTEFNQIGGQMFVEENLFGIRSALTTADILMTALSLRQPGDPVFEAACLYQFQSPCTHRNFKSLVYGDMNCLDWTSQTDLALNRRGEQWYPTDSELQLRHPTPAYFMFRMLARCVASAEKNQGNPVLRQGYCAFRGNRQNVYSSLKELVVKTPDSLLINILNPTDDKAENLEFDISEFAGQYRFVVVRECSRQSRDQVKSVFPIDGNTIKLDAAPLSLIQIILTPLALDRVEFVRLEEITATPGTAGNLNLFQTSRFKMLAKLNGQEYDLSDLNTKWTSSEPNYVDVLGAGLVIRLRNSYDPIEICAELAGAKHLARIQIPGLRMPDKS